MGAALDIATLSQLKFQNFKVLLRSVRKINKPNNVMLAFATTVCTKKSNDYVIMLKNHERALHVNAAGKVTAADMSLAQSEPKSQFFTMESIGDIFSETFKIALFVKEVGRYLCFRRGKLVGLVKLKEFLVTREPYPTENQIHNTASQLGQSNQYGISNKGFNFGLWYLYYERYEDKSILRHKFKYKR
uniref:Uncharacterized protein n=1 Tax=Glossina austeni TaxID=7395 RepID=A0A1A9V023_GLOAU